MWRCASVLGILLISPIPALARQGAADRPRVELGGHVSILPDCGLNTCGSSAVKAGPRLAVNFAARAAVEVDVDIQVGTSAPATQSVITLVQVKYTLHHFSHGGLFMTVGVASGMRPSATRRLRCRELRRRTPRGHGATPLQCLRPAAAASGRSRIIWRCTWKPRLFSAATRPSGTSRPGASSLAS